MSETKSIGADADLAHPPKKWQAVLGTWTHWVHLGYIALVFAGYAAAGLLHTQNVSALIAYVGLFVYVLVLIAVLVCFIVQSTKHYARLYDHLYVPHARKARYANAVLCIKRAMHNISEMNWYLSECAEERAVFQTAYLRDTFQATLDSVSKAFEIVTLERNRICIKLVGQDGDEQFVKTLSRDSNSHSESRDQDRAEGNTHKVDQNTAYRQIIRGGRPYFFCNDISNYPDYDNTSKALLGNKSLPYESCIVYPIRLIPGSDVPTKSEQRPSDIILGFIAVDSKVKGTYNEQFDVDLIGLVAEALFPALNRWRFFEMLQRTEPVRLSGVQ